MKINTHCLVMLLIISITSSSFAKNSPLFTISTQKSSATMPVEGTYLTMDQETLKNLYAKGDDQITITIPQFSKAAVEVTLSKVQLLGDNFYVSTQSDQGRKTTEYTPGNYYQNTSNGNLAAISIFENELSGVVTLNGTQYTLGPIVSENKSVETTYVFYNESSLPQPTFECETEDGVMTDFPQTYPAVVNSVMDRLVYTYFEVDHAYYESEGGVTGAVNFITGMFNVVQAIYDLEEINVQISEISVWTQPNSYNETSRGTILSDFLQSVECVNGDLAHYIHQGPFGGVAYVNQLCGNLNFTISSIINSYQEFPFYSYAIYTVAHETGHVLGSPHTHSCSWPGGAIDNCAQTEGSCDPGPFPTEGGTIMSYCTGNMDFALGLGPLPGQLVRDIIDGATCLGQVEYVSIFDEDVYGCTTGVFELDATYEACENCTYVWNDGIEGAVREVEVFEPTDFCVSVTDAQGNIFADHIAVNEYVLIVGLNIVAPTSCTPGTVTVQPSGGTGEYTYLWSDGSTGITNNNLEIGSYSVTLDDGVCSRVKAFTLESGTGINMNRPIGSSSNDALQELIENTAGELVLAGSTSGQEGELASFLGNSNFCLVNMSKQGDVNWIRHYGGPSYDYCRTLIQTSDGGYLLGGSSSGVGGDVQGDYGSRDGWLVKTNEMGEIEWTQNYGGSSFDLIWSVIELTNGEYAFVGTSSSGDQDIVSPLGGSDLWLAKVSSNGALLWSKNFGGSDNEDGVDVIQNTDGDLMVLGEKFSSDFDQVNNIGGKDLVILKIDLDGDLIWARSYGGDANEEASQIIETSDGNFAVAGSSPSSNGDLPGNYGSYDAWVFKINPFANIIWSQNYGGIASEYMGDLIETNDNGLMAIGQTNSESISPTNSGDFYLLNLDAMGALISESAYGSFAYDYGVAILQTENDDFFVAGQAGEASYDVPTNVGQSDFWVFQLTENPGAIVYIEASSLTLENGPVTLTASPPVVNPMWSTGETTQSIIVDAPGTYTLTGGETGCTNTDIVTITETSCDLIVISSNNSITIVGLSSFENAKLFDSNTNVVWTCNPWSGICNNTETISGLPTGATYFVSVQSDDCDEWIEIVVQDGGCTDDDNDSVCAEDDCDDTDPSIPTTPGTSCDDGDPNTINDVILADGCTCEGVPDEGGCNVTVSSSNGSVTITGLTSSENTKLFDVDIEVVWNCSPWSGSPCTDSETITGLTVGATYYVSVQSDDCSEWIAIVVEGGQCTDNDNDGVCAEEDCDDADPNIPTTPGTSCDDGDPNTINDVILADGCTCEGVPDEGGCNVIVSSSNGSVTITGLTSTENTKLFDVDIEVVWSCGPWSGSPCTDSETITGLTVGATYYVSVQSDDCSEWIAIEVEGGQCTDNDNDGVCAEDDCDDADPNIPTTPGTSCDDGDPNTINDVILADGCTCEGEPDSGGCNVSVSSSNGSITITGLTSNENTKLFDVEIEVVWGCSPWNGSPCTDLETITGLTVGATYYVSVQSDDCQEWIPIEVEGGQCTDNDNDGVCVEEDCDDNDSSIPAPIGTSCDDGDSNTENDVIQSDNCTCEGTPINTNLADLTVYDFGYVGSTTLASGSVLNFTFTGANIGTIGTGSFNIKSYISEDQSLSSDDIQDGIIPTGNFAAGVVIDNIGGSLTVPSSLPEGDYYVIIVIDGDDQIDELNESNNTLVSNATFTVVNDVDCPSELSQMTYMGEFESHSYFISDVVDYWLDAEGFAGSVGGYLVSINSEEENEFIRTYLDINNDIVFIGYNDADGDETYEWDSGENVTYTNDQGAFLEEFATMNFWNGEWSYDGIFVQRKFVIEFPCVNNSNFAIVNAEQGNDIVEAPLSDEFSIQSIFPNPTAGNLFVEINSSFDQSAQLTIYDRFGQALKANAVELRKGSQKLGVQSADLANGIYLLVITNEKGEQETVRFVRAK